ncbi:MAG: hypothetical protein EBE86_020720 [Hormoscilla sp. GUM202]|nr:hypothetical protein [Hormoscilla sp. GUM202]
MSEVIAGDGFTVKTNKFEFFFGRVTSNPKNERRSFDNLNGLRQLGIEEEADGRERLMEIFRSGLKGPQVGIKGDRYGTTIVRKVEIIYQEVRGAIEVSYLYRNNDLESTPEVTTLITKIYQE